MTRSLLRIGREGSDTVAKVEANIKEAKAMLAEWRKVGASTDFAA